MTSKKLKRKIRKKITKKQYKMIGFVQSLIYLNSKGYTIYEGKLMGEKYFTIVKGHLEKKELSAKEVISFANKILVLNKRR